MCPKPKFRWEDPKSFYGTYSVMEGVGRLNLIRSIKQVYADGELTPELLPKDLCQHLWGHDYWPRFKPLDDEDTVPDGRPRRTSPVQPVQPVQPVCECGGDAINSTHSSWCPKAVSGRGG